jgi:hypothetical protein
VVGEERGQRLRARVRQDSHADASKTLGVYAFHGAAHESLLALLSSAAQAGVLAADEEFVHLDLACEAFPAGAYQRKPLGHRSHDR